MFDITPEKPELPSIWNCECVVDDLILLLSERISKQFAQRWVTRWVRDLIESTYEHDDEGRRIEGDSPVSGADVVEELMRMEPLVRRAGP